MKTITNLDNDLKEPSGGLKVTDVQSIHYSPPIIKPDGSSYFKPLLSFKELQDYINIEVPYNAPKTYTIEDIDEFTRMLHCVGFKHKTDLNSKYGDKINLISLGGCKIFNGSKNDCKPLVPQKGKLLRKSSKLKLIEYIKNSIEWHNPVYMPCNPLKSFVWRSRASNSYQVVEYSKANVTRIHNIIIESDDESLEQQYKLLEALLPWTSCAMFTGNKSIHIWLNVGSINPNYKLLEYSEVLANLVNNLNTNNFKCDMKVLKNYVVKTRLPNIPHQTTGKRSKIIYLNDKALWFSEYTEFSIKGSIPVPPEQPSPKLEIKDNVSILNSDTNGVTFLKPNGKKPSKKSSKITPEYIHNIPNFFNNLDMYIQYMEYGLKSKGLRSSMYRDVIFAKKILDARFCKQKVKDNVNILNGVTNGVTFYEDCLSEVTQILELSEGRYQCSFEEAIEDFKDYYAKSLQYSKLTIRMPNSTKLPVRCPMNLKTLKTILKQLGIQNRTHVAKIILNVLWPLLRTLPAQCDNGTVGIHMNRDIRGEYLKNGVRCKFEDSSKYVNSKYVRATMETLKKHNILIKTRNYIYKEQTSKYWINAPLILWLVTNDKDVAWRIPIPKQ